MDGKEQIKSMLQDFINDKKEQSQMTLHNYLNDKMKQITGYSKHTETNVEADGADESSADLDENVEQID